MHKNTIKKGKKTEVSKEKESSSSGGGESSSSDGVESSSSGGGESFWGIFLQCLRNCGMCCWLCGMCCWLCCCPPCPSEIIRKCAFRPPKRSYYFISREKANRRITKPTRKTRFLFPLRIGFETSIFQPHKYCSVHVPLGANKQELLTSYAENLKDAQCFFTKTSRGNWIACVFYPCPLKPAKSTIFFSHPNGVDLGFTSDTDCFTFWQSNLFAYDFSGYGISSGRCTEKNLYADTLAAYSALLMRFKLQAEDVILMGRSLGTAAVIDLASKVSGTAGVVLISPFQSAVRLFNATAPLRKAGVEQRADTPKNSKLECFDAFVSFEKIPNIKSPVLVVHGRKDQVVPFSQGLEIYEKCSSAVEPLWLQNAHHNDLEHWPDYWIGIRKFISEDLGRGPLHTDVLEEKTKLLFDSKGISIHPQCAISTFCLECLEEFERMKYIPVRSFTCRVQLETFKIVKLIRRAARDPIALRILHKIFKEVENEKPKKKSREVVKKAKIKSEEKSGEETLTESVTAFSHQSSSSSPSAVRNETRYTDTRKLKHPHY